MKQCPDCGARIEEGAEECPSCGPKAEAVPQPSTEKNKGRLPSCLMGLLAAPILLAVFIMFISPGFLRFQAKAKQEEAKYNLRLLWGLQTDYFHDHNTYAPTFKHLGWEPEMENLYSYILPGEIIENKKGLQLKWCSIPAEEYPCGAGTNGFTIAAIGNVDCDDLFDVWTMNHNAELINVYVDP
jgi:hypothetical protein